MNSDLLDFRLGPLFLSKILTAIFLLGFGANALGVSGGVVDLDLKTSKTAQSTVQIETGFVSCSAVLISPNAALTAAHCLKSMALDQDKKTQCIFCGRVVFDFLDSENGLEKKERRNISQIIAHPGSELKLGEEQGVISNRHDLAIVFFKGSLPEGFQPAALVEDGKKSEEKSEDCHYWISGFSSVNQKTTRRTGEVSAQNLAQEFSLLFNALVWTVYKEPNACVGDSGGPLFRQCSRKRLEVMGLMSIAPAACQRGIYENVWLHKAWIEKELARPSHP